MSLVSLAESIRVIIYKNPQVLYDLLGPGYYLLFLSIGLFVTGVVYIYYHSKAHESTATEKAPREMKIRLIASFLVCAIYVILIDVVGYAVGTFVFFALMFRIVEIRSWPLNLLLSLSLTTVCYFIFVKYCSVVFPHGILF